MILMASFLLKKLYFYEQFMKSKFIKKEGGGHEKTYYWLGSVEFTSHRG
jgi:hypothetical protein